MIPIGLLSACMWIMIALKTDWIWRVKRCSLAVGDALEYLQSGKAPEGTESCPKTRALAYFMNHYFKGRKSLHGDSAQLFLEVAVRRQLRDLYCFIPAIMILASAAPLLGLLGTVTGMVETFEVIGRHGMGNIQAMASGIKEALITTQAGLLVAIPGVLVGQALRKKVRGIHQDVLVFHRAVSQWLEKELR